MSRSPSPASNSGNMGSSGVAPPPQKSSLTSYANFDHLKIAVRERPLADGEASSVQVVLRTDQDKLIAFYPSSKEGLVYNYDHFFPAESTQSDIFHTIGDEMVSLAVNGFSTTFIGVGPSSAGKTHTMFGSDQEAGLIQHVTREIFNQVHASSDDFAWKITAQYFEVNGDDICDALSSACSPTAATVIGVTAADAFRAAAMNSKSVAENGGVPTGGLEEMVRLRKDTKFGGYAVGGIKEVVLNNWDELDMLLLKGNNRRIQLAEKRRARWHGFVRINIERIPKLSPSTVSRCIVQFVHTKGPERVGEQGTRGEQMKQGSRLNKGLSLLNSAVLHCTDFRRKALKEAMAQGKNIQDPAVLGDVIDRSQSFFMESKFTQLMGYSMCGRAATFMVGCVSSTNYHDCTDTLEMLQNAQQLTACVPTRVNITQFGKLQQELDVAERKCAESGAGTLAQGHPLSEIEERVEKLRQRLSNQELDDEDAQRRPPPPMIQIPDGLQKWKQDTLKAKMHGSRATVYIPTKRGADQYDTYKGDWARGFKDGQGEHITSKTKYVGEWSQGLRDGEGTLWVRSPLPTNPNAIGGGAPTAATSGGTFTSTTSSVANNVGVATIATPGTQPKHATQQRLKTQREIDEEMKGEWVRVYKGAWRKGLRHGYGMQWCSNGETYEGYFENDQRSHVGKLFRPNGDRVEGQFAGSQIHGWATLYVQNGDWFEGRWFEGMREGPGIYHYVAREQVYHGSWHKNIAKCGVMEDMPKKSTNANSTFLPRCTLAEPDKVLSQMRAELEQLRMQEFGVADFETAPKGPSADKGPMRPGSGTSSGNEQIGW